jgi:hypothetical protein
MIVCQNELERPGSKVDERIGLIVSNGIVDDVQPEYYPDNCNGAKQDVNIFGVFGGYEQVAERVAKRCQSAP